MGTRTCSPDTNSSNAQTATKLGYHRDFAPIKVAIESIDANGSIHFTAKGSTTDYVTTWKIPDVWAACPTTVDSGGGGLPTAGSEGILYVGVPVWNQLDSNARQYSPGLKWPEELSQRWESQSKLPGIDVGRSRPPEELAFDTLGFALTDGLLFNSLPLSSSYHELEIAVDRVHIAARVPGQTGRLEFELLETDAPAQVLDLDPIYTTLLVRNASTGKYEPVKMQILSALMHGQDPRTQISAQIDLLDPTLSDAFQTIDFHGGTKVKPRLSQRGFARFGHGWHPASPDQDDTTRSRVVTFIARPAKGVSPIPPDGDNAIEQIRKAIEPYVGIREVSSLAEIARELSELEFKPETVQFIGHGAPGSLSLGYFWDPSKYTDDDGGPFYLLDSNPYAYGLLMSFVSAPTTVLLAGCNITSSTQPSPMIADGRALVSDLYAMWSCDVLAADDFVGPSDFDRGVFIGSRQGFVGNAWTHLGTPRPPLPPAGKQDEPAAPAPKFTDLTIVSAPALGSLNRVFRERIADAPGNLLDGYISPVDPGPILAMNEISLQGKLDGEDVQLHLICDSQLLKVVSAGSPPRVRYFARGTAFARKTGSGPSARTHVLATLRENQLRRLSAGPSKPDGAGDAAGNGAPGKTAGALASTSRPLSNGQSSGPQPSV
jgi:hypothetical protein